MSCNVVLPECNMKSQCEYNMKHYLSKNDTNEKERKKETMSM